MKGKWIKVALVASFLAACLIIVSAQEQKRTSSYAPVDLNLTFATVMGRMKAAKAEVMRRQMALLNERYDLSRRVSNDATMFRGKPIPVGPTARLGPGITWEKLAEMPAGQIRENGLFPKGFLPLPHPNHPEGGMVFPKMMIDELVKMGEGNRLERFDLDFDLPEHFLPEFPPAMFLTTRPDLGDISQGELVTLENYYELFNGILNPKQLEGLRLLVTQFPQQQFNATEDRRTEIPSRGVTCFDCHVNGHTNGATHLIGDIRPQENRRRIEPPSLRGLYIQRLFGSQRALKTVEDFTEFEQRAAYFDGDPVIATKKGVTYWTGAARFTRWLSSKNC
jgi:cytochrome c peroxidase